MRSAIVSRMQCVPTVPKLARFACVFIAGLVATSGLSGCLVAGASSNGGWFIWPGGLGLVVMILLVLFLLRRR